MKDAIMVLQIRYEELLRSNKLYHLDKISEERNASDAMVSQFSEAIRILGRAEFIKRFPDQSTNVCDQDELSATLCNYDQHNADIYYLGECSICKSKKRK